MTMVVVAKRLTRLPVEQVIAGSNPVNHPNVPLSASAQAGLQSRSRRGSTGRRCHYVYRLVNKVNGKIYIGVGSSDDPDSDGYFGSGKIVRKAVLKYGRDAFTKEVLERFETADAAYSMERDIVDDAFVTRADTYNLRLGGSGGFDYVNRARLNVSGRNFRPGNLLRGAAEMIPLLKERGTYEQYRRRLSEASAAKAGAETSFFGRHHTSEAKRRMGAKNSILLRGPANGAYGKRWINDGSAEKRVSAEEVHDHVALGWSLGRA